jgi:uncharacterized protein YjbI with pentapeptide repeats
MPVSAPALVRPRCFDPDTGDIVLLEDEVLEFLERQPRGVIEILGGRGSGKSTALAYLRDLVAVSVPTEFLDDPSPTQISESAARGSVVYTASVYVDRVDLCLRLAPWGDDELIEFLRAAHPHSCATVLQRVLAAEDRRELAGVPELWVMAIERMVADGSLASAKLALRSALGPHLIDPEVADLAGSYSWSLQIGAEKLAKQQSVRLVKAGASTELLRALRWPLVQLVLASENVAAALAERRTTCLTSSWPRKLVCETAQRIVVDPQTVASLLADFEGRVHEKVATLASLLHACGRLVHARLPKRPLLGGAFLEGIIWKGVNLTRAQLDRTDLSGADLSTAQLDQASACGIQLTGACLREASLWSIGAIGGDFREADLSGANAMDAALAGADLSRARMEKTVLTNANLRQANLTAAICRSADFSRAELEDATIDEADFSGARFDSANLSRLPLYKAVLTDARFVSACLRRCDLEGVDLPQAHFERATLVHANLTGSRMPGAKFAGADLRGAYLADISWERAILQDADLRDVTFHMGSSRSGLLFTPLASEGTRTGFYTDDYEEQYFKRPEEIRKANLRGADLRGARIENVDFYLVDLRDALYDAKQAEHFRRCRAILSD